MERAAHLGVGYERLARMKDTFSCRGRDLERRVGVDEDVRELDTWCHGAMVPLGAVVAGRALSVYKVAALPVTDSGALRRRVLRPDSYRV